MQYIKAEYERDTFVLEGPLLRHTPQCNELGWPALAASTANGSVQVAGRPGNEPAVLAVGRRLGLPSEDVVVAR